MADFDLDMQILDTLQQLGISPSSEHIHSHQEADFQDSDEPLPWKVQINTRCDEIATDYLRQQSRPTTKVPFLPATKVALVVDDITITGRIPAQIRHHCGATFQYNQRSQIQHLQKIHQWTKSQLESVDWDTFHTATNKKASFGNQHFILRWANHILPLMERHHRWNITASSECPSACGGDEDETHLIRCPHPARQPPRTSLHAALVATFDQRHVDPWLRQILLSFLALSDPSICYNLDALTHPYRRLLEDQSSLGAESLYFGYFHKSWVRLQHAYLRSQDLPCERRQARTLVTTWAQLFQTTARAQWDIRNAHLHEAAEGQRPHSETLLRITASELYDDIENLSPRDRASVFQNMTLIQRLATPVVHLHAWVKFAKPVIAYIKTHALPPTGNTDIRDFFRPLQNHAPPTGRPPGHPSRRRRSL
jgi:hypothetical protein